MLQGEPARPSVGNLPTPHAAKGPALASQLGLHPREEEQRRGVESFRPSAAGWSSQPLGVSAEVRPSPPPSFLIASHGQLFSESRSGRSRKRIPAVFP